MKQVVKRNILTFEAPNILAERAKKLAEENMVSTGAICRQALRYAEICGRAPYLLRKMRIFRNI